MNTDTDFADNAWIEGAGGRVQRTGHRGRDARRLQAAPPGRHGRARLVVISETAWAGWRAYIDGRRVRMCAQTKHF